MDYLSCHTLWVDSLRKAELAHCYRLTIPLLQMYWLFHDHRYMNDMNWVIDGIIWIGVFGEIEELVG